MGKLIEYAKDNLTLEKVLEAAMQTPGVNIDRDRFLKKELLCYCDESTIEKAISTNPARAGISKDTINKISKKVIDYETTKVTGLSVAASVPGGAAAVGAAAVDITSYFAFILRTTQELAYLYGFPELEWKEDNIDSGTKNEILVFLGVMFGVEGASKALGVFAEKYAEYISKTLANKALTKGVVYPLFKKIGTNVGYHITKQVFADVIASSIPLLGGVLSGGLTYAMFKPCCIKLRNSLMSYDLCNPDFYKNSGDNESNNGDIIDVEVIE